MHSYTLAQGKMKNKRNYRKMMKYGIKHKILGFETSEVGFETFYMEWEIVRQEGI